MRAVRPSLTPEQCLQYANAGLQASLAVINPKVRKLTDMITFITGIAGVYALGAVSAAAGTRDGWIQNLLTIAPAHDEGASNQ